MAKARRDHFIRNGETVGRADLVQAPATVDLEEMSKAQLVEHAEELGIEVYASWSAARLRGEITGVAEFGLDEPA